MKRRNQVGYLVLAIADHHLLYGVIKFFFTKKLPWKLWVGKNSFYLIFIALSPLETTPNYGLGLPS